MAVLPAMFSGEIIGGIAGPGVPGLGMNKSGKRTFKAMT